MEKSRELARDSSHAVHPFARNKGKELLIPDDDNALTDDELFPGRSLSMSLTLGRNAWGNIRAK